MESSCRQALDALDVVISRVLSTKKCWQNGRTAEVVAGWHTFRRCFYSAYNGKFLTRGEILTPAPHCDKCAIDEIYEIWNKSDWEPANDTLCFTDEISADMVYEKYDADRNAYDGYTPSKDNNHGERYDFGRRQKQTSSWCSVL